MLIFGLLSLKGNRDNASPGFIAFGLFFLFAGIASCFGMQTGVPKSISLDLRRS